MSARDPAARCVICGEPEHRDADDMIERCEWYNFHIERFEPVYLRDIGPTPGGVYQHVRDVFA